MTRYEFAAVGDNCIDRFLAPIGMSLVGGNAVNVAVQLARLGRSSTYFGAVGADDDGRLVRMQLDRNGVDTTHVKQRGQVTAHTDIRVMPDGDRQIVAESFGACDGYAPDELERELLYRMRHVHVGWLNDGGALRSYLAARGVRVSQDIAVNGHAVDKSVDGLAVAFDSAGTDADLGRVKLNEMLASGAGCAVVTLGVAGSLASDGKTTVSAGIQPVHAVDTTGAGDSFIAGFLSAFTDNQPLQTCLELGSARAAMTCCHIGGFPQEPRRT
jgi:fructoselysine 6-kinase